MYRPIFNVLLLSDSERNFLCICCRALHIALTVLLHTLPCEIQNFKLTAERYVIKLINFTWNLTQRNNIQMTNATKISVMIYFTYVQRMNHGMHLRKKVRNMIW